MTPRPLTLADLWLPGDVLDGALLRGWTGAVWALRGTEWIGATWAPHMGCAPVIYGGKVDSFAGVADVRLDFRRQEVRDRAVRVLGPDLLPIHAAELRGDITPGEAAGLVWCSVVRREAGLPVVGGWAPCLNFTNTRGSAGTLLGRSYNWLKDDGDGLFPARWEAEARCLSADESDPLPMDRYGWRWGHVHGPELGDEGLDKIHAAALAAGYSLRDPGGILLLPLPDGVVGRLECGR